MFKLESNNGFIVDKSNFRTEVLRSKEIVLVEFFTEWSGACHIMEPVLKEVMQQYKGRLKFCKIDFDKSKGIVSKYNILKVPAILIFKDARIIEKVEGVVSKKVMLNKIKILLRNVDFEKIW